MAPADGLYTLLLRGGADPVQLLLNPADVDIDLPTGISEVDEEFQRSVCVFPLLDQLFPLEANPTPLPNILLLLPLEL